MVDLTPNKTALLILGAILEMSDRAEQMGGAKSISGVAALHKLQTSIQKNRARIIEAARLEQESL